MARLEASTARFDVPSAQLLATILFHGVGPKRATSRLQPRNDQTPRNQQQCDAPQERMKPIGHLQDRSPGNVVNVYGRSRGIDALCADAAETAHVAGVATRSNAWVDSDETQALPGQPSASSQRNPNGRGTRRLRLTQPGQILPFGAQRQPCLPTTKVTALAFAPTHLPTPGTEISTIRA